MALQDEQYERVSVALTGMTSRAPTKTTKEMTTTEVNHGLRYQARGLSGYR
jgi:hypothetical protein